MLLYRGKSAADIVNPKSSKYILLDSSNKSTTGRVLPPGEHKGTLKSVESSDAGIVITTQNEDFLEMKVNTSCFYPINDSFLKKKSTSIGVSTNRP